MALQRFACSLRQAGGGGKEKARAKPKAAAAKSKATDGQKSPSKEAAQGSPDKPKPKVAKKASDAEKHGRSPQKESPNPSLAKRLKGKQEDPDQQKQIEELKEAGCFLFFSSLGVHILYACNLHIMNYLRFAG